MPPARAIASESTDDERRQRLATDWPHTIAGDHRSRQKRTLQTGWDPRDPEKLLDLIGTKSQEVAEAVVALRVLRRHRTERTASLLMSKS